ncbi:MAG: hypothetical protein ACOYJ6_19330 [Caulobacterales bacterium]
MHARGSQGCFDFNSNKIFFVIQPAAAILVLGVDPARPDQRQEHTALNNDGWHIVAKLHAARNGIDVLKDAALAELAFQPVKDAARVAAGVRPPITDEDTMLRHPWASMLPFKP